MTQASQQARRSYASHTDEVDLAETAHELDSLMRTAVPTDQDHDPSSWTSRPPVPKLSNESPDRHVPSRDAASNRERSRLVSGSDRSIPEAFIDSLPYHTPIRKPDGYPELTYKPLLLRRRLLFPLLIFYISCAGFVAALVVMNVLAPADLHIRKSVSYNAFNYLPTVLGSITTITFRALVSSYGRILPYLTMSSATFRTRQRNDTHNTNTILAASVVSLQLFTGNAGFELLRYGHQLTFSLFWSRVFVVGFFVTLKTALIRVTVDSHGWQISISNAVGYILIACYVVLIGETVAIMVRTWNATTGLKWDVGSYAAQIALFQHSNVPAVLRALDLDWSTTKQELVGKLKGIPVSLGPLRLGYWQAAEDETRILHGISFIGSPKKPVRTTIDPSKSSPDAQGMASPRDGRAKHEPMVRSTDTSGEYKTRRPENHRYFCPMIPLSDFVLLLGLLGCCAIIVAFSSWISSGKLKTGWSFEHLSVESTGVPSFTWLGEVYLAAVPSFINSLFSIIWFNADLFYRTTEPLAGMFTPQYARENLLLDYVSPDPVSNFASSLGRKHWRVAYFTLLTLVAPYMSTFAANIFFIRRGDLADHLLLIPTNFYVSLVTVSLYAASFLVARPSIRYRFPRTIFNISDLLSYCYDSSLITADEFSVQEPDDEDIHLQSKVHLAKRKYCFGFYRGADGRRHLGFDVDNITNADGTVASVDTVIPGKFPCFPFRKPWWIGSRRHENCRPRLARPAAKQLDGSAEPDEGGNLARMNSVAPSFTTAHEFAEDGLEDDGQIRPIRHVDTLLLEAGLGHGPRPSQPAAGSSGVTRFQQNNRLQQRTAVDEHFHIDTP